MWQFVAADNPRLADQLTDRIILAVDRLENYPHMGRAGRITGTRELVVAGTQFVVAYRARQEIEVLAILHGSREWPEAL